MGDRDKVKSPPSVKRRSSRACDQCRKAKAKCERYSDDEPCNGCKISNVECTTIGPNNKRGPPKGYLRAVETHLHEAEAVLGIVLALPCPYTREVLKALGEDPYLHRILSRLESCPFGPGGRPHGARLIDGFPQTAKDRPMYDLGSKANPYKVGPTNAWQDYILSRAVNNLGASYINPQMPFSLLFGGEVWAGDGSPAGALYPTYQQQFDGMSDNMDSPTDSYLQDDDESVISNTSRGNNNVCSQGPRSFLGPTPVANTSYWLGGPRNTMPMASETVPWSFLTRNMGS